MFRLSTLSQAFFLILLVFTAPSSAAVLSRQYNTNPTVRVLNGTYSGLHSSTYSQDIFLGIPYSQPPVGDLRFRQAQPLNTSWPEARNATDYSPECIGYGSDTYVLGDIVSEDCLTLNVIKPSGAGSNLPVGVWIHGGGQVQGGSRDPRYNLSFIVQQSVYAKTPFIAVSINYRLQGWGFLFGKEVLEAGSANMGIRDQRLALHWIQENIAAFGGDPSKVTIWGESAGGIDVGMQIVAYGGRDDKLFRAAITESGSPESVPFTSPEEWQPTYDNITLAANCSTAADTLACLRTVPVNVLSSILNSSVTSEASWGPQIDNDFLEDYASSLVANGKFVKVPLLAGQNHDEGTAFGIRGVDTTEQFLAMVISTGPDNATATEIAALYPDIPALGIPGTLSGRPASSTGLGSQWKRSAAYNGDLWIHAPRRHLTQMWAQYNVDCYSYLFNVLPNGVDPTIGVTHFQEVAFMMDNVDGLGYSSNPFAGEPESYIQVASMMSRMWASFIVNLDPNRSGASLVDWPKYTLENPQNIVFDVNVTNLAYVEADTYRKEGIAYIQDRLASVYKK